MDKKIWMVYTTGAVMKQTLFLRSETIRVSHLAAREYFGKGVSFTVEEATQEVLELTDPGDIKDLDD